VARKLAMTVALAALAIPGAAHAASPGDVILTGALPLPAGAIAGGNGGYADDEPTTIGVSEDGRYVAFAADADALSPDAHPDVTNIFRKDRATGDVVLVSRATGANGVAPDAHGFEPTISDDGGRVAWRTRAALDPADTDGQYDVYVRDIGSGTTMLATPDATESVFAYDLSGDGAYVAFATATAIAAADGNGASDVYRRALGSGTTVLVSRKAGSAQAGDGASRDPSISDDGRWVAFASEANDLVAGFVDGGASTDVFARDVTAATAYLVSSQAVAPLIGGNGTSGRPQIAGAPGAAIATAYIAYNSQATDVAGAGVDASSVESVYRRRLSIASSTLISRATGFVGENADSRAHVGAIDDSATKVTFSSDADNLGAGDDYYGAYVRDTGAGTTALVSADNHYAVEPVISDDGAVAAWVNGSGGITPDSDPDLAGVFARVTGGAPEYISRPPGTAPFLAPVTRVADAGAGGRSISADGRFVVFAAYSRRLPGNATGDAQVYRRDTLTGAIELVSRSSGATGVPADKSSIEPTISADGTRVAFRTKARLEATDTDDLTSVYVRDLATATTTLASRADGGGGALPDADANEGRISADGVHVTFTSAATNLGAADGNRHVYLRGLASGHTELLDRASGPAGAVGNDDAEWAAASGDGRVVAFATKANNLDPADPAPSTLSDVYVRDTVAQTTLLASRRSGLDGAKAVGASRSATFSADGRVVAFETTDDAVAPEGGPWGGSNQVVARDVATGQNTLVSRAPGGAAADAAAHDPSVSGDGSVIAFSSSATNLLGGVGGNGRSGVFARTMATGALSGPPAFGLGVPGPYGAKSPSLSDDGRCLAFDALGHNAFAGTAGDFRTGYVYVIAGGCPTPGGSPPPAGGKPSKPAITGASLLHKRFRVGKRATAKRASVARRRTPKGTAFRFRLSAAADLTITVQRRVRGRRAGGACRKPTRKLRKRPACVRFVKRGTLTRRGLAAKRHSIAFSGRVGRKALKPGRYRATLRARNVAGTSRRVHLAFRVVRR
jgi:Tol biopolymer transport system component